MKNLRPLSFILLVTTLSVLLASCGTVGRYNLSQLPNQYSQVALLLPLHGRYAGAGKAIRNGFFAGYYSNSQQSGAATTVKVYDTSKSTDVRKLYAEAVAEGAQMVIGPLTKANVKLLARHGNISVPTIALNYTARDYQPPSLFFEFGISPQNEAVQTATKAYNAGLQAAIIIAPQSSWGENIVSAFSQQWQQLGAKVVDSYYYPPKQNLRYAIRDLLKVHQSEARGKSLESTLGEKVTFAPQRRKDFDVIFLVAPPQSARQLLPLLRFYYAGNIPIYSIAMLYKGIPDPSYYRDMNGVIFGDIPWVFNSNANQSVKNNFKSLWPRTYQNFIRLYALGLDAYMLTKNLKQLPSTPQSGINGDTGKLYFGNNNWILQQYVWAQFRSGKAVPVYSNVT